MCQQLCQDTRITSLDTFFIYLCGFFAVDNTKNFVEICGSSYDHDECSNTVVRMCTPTAWQLGEDFKGKLLPVLRDVKELKGKIELEISHKQDEMEFGPMAIRKPNQPTPEDPAKIRKLGENITLAIMELVQQYERLCQIEAERGAIQETGQVTTTCPDIVENQSECSMVLPTPETECPRPFTVATEVMEYQDAVFADPNKPVSPTSRPRLRRGAAVENEETIDLAQK